jgi:DNA modification methylase
LQAQAELENVDLSGLKNQNASSKKWQVQSDNVINSFYKDLFFVGSDLRPMVDLGFLDKFYQGALSQMKMQDDAEDESIASSLDDLITKAEDKSRDGEQLQWARHMNNMNKAYKKEIAELDKVIAECEEGASDMWVVDSAIA